jgi:UDP-3-O-[3-hydroxymyristoyl] glucosamine N-acyltransferase
MKGNGMTLTVDELASLVGGERSGDGSAVIRSALPLGAAIPGCVTFLSNKHRADRLAACQATAILVPHGVEAPGKTTISVADPLAAMLRAAERLEPADPPAPVGIHPTADVDATVEIGEGVWIGAFAVIGPHVRIGPRSRIHPHVVVESGCRLGADVEIHSHVLLCRRTEVGDRSVIHAGAVIGRSGFGFRLQEGSFRRVPQLGSVVVGADVEIGSNTTVDRATFGATVIGDGTKIDNLVQIGHNCRIGKHNVLAGHVGVSGSCTTGEYVMLGGKVGVADHVNIGDRTRVGAGTGLDGDLPANGSFMAGIRAMPELQGKKVAVLAASLPDMRREMAQLRRRLEALEAAAGIEPRRAAG